MSFANGRLPASALAPIPGGQLRKDAALRWNAMCFYLRAHGRPIPMPNGPMSSYRTMAGQVFLRNQWCARGACQNAAVPGSSNHGWGIAVDTQGSICDSVPQFGFHKRFSDAPWESWHRKWGGFGSTAGGPKPPRVLRRGSHPGMDVSTLKLRLRRIRRPGGVDRRYWSGACDGRYGLRVRRAVRAFQRDHHMTADGIVGPKTAAAIKRAAK